MRVCNGCKHLRTTRLFNICEAYRRILNYDNKFPDVQTPKYCIINKERV